MIHPIEYLKGVGPLRSEALKKELNIHTFKDLFYFYPFRYVDRTRIYKIKEINAEMPYIQICGKITHVDITGPKRKQRMQVDLEDDTGQNRIDMVSGNKMGEQKITPRCRIYRVWQTIFFSRSAYYFASFHGRNDIVKI